MIQFVFVALLGASTALEESSHERNGRNLVGTFPFNANIRNHDHHDQRHVQHHQDLDARDQRQGSNDGVPDVFGLANARDREGKKCVKKVEMVNVTEYDEEVHCDHSYDKRCHTTYVTEYESQQEEECEENFRKNCFIDYEKIAWNETVEVCKVPLIKNCDKKGPEVCTTEYETECWTTTDKHKVIDDVVACRTVVDKKCYPVTNGYTTEERCTEWPREECEVTKKPVEKHTPITGCHKIPIEICAPAGCKLEPAPKPECWPKVQTIVQDKPKEECTLEPQRTCKHVTKLVPKLTPTEECVDVPKEVCSRSRVRPHTVPRPVVKHWCYVPSKESGLA